MSKNNIGPIYSCIPQGDTLAVFPNVILCVLKCILVLGVDNQRSFLKFERTNKTKVRYSSNSLFLSDHFFILLDF